MRRWIVSPSRESTARIPPREGQGKPGAARRFPEGSGWRGSPIITRFLGLPIGNLNSEFFASGDLDALDHFALLVPDRKRLARRVCGRPAARRLPDGAATRRFGRW